MLSPENKISGDFTCLGYAVGQLLDKVVVSLVEHGAEINPKTGQTPLLIALLLNDVKTAKFLIEKYGARIDEN